MFHLCMYFIVQYTWGCRKFLGQKGSRSGKSFRKHGSPWTRLWLYGDCSLSLIFSSVSMATGQEQWTTASLVSSSLLSGCVTFLKISPVGPGDTELASHIRSLVCDPQHAIHRTCWHLTLISHSEGEGQALHHYRVSSRITWDSFSHLTPFWASWSDHRHFYGTEGDKGWGERQCSSSLTGIRNLEEKRKWGRQKELQIIERYIIQLIKS